MKLICGIDEAGRGPVIGPMVIAGVTVREDLLAELEQLGVKDSKLCSRKKRESLYDRIIALAACVRIVRIDPAEIDRALTDPLSNLNLLEMRHQASIIDASSPDEVLLDCPSVNITAYTEGLLALLARPDTPVHAEHGADRRYPVVSAASIIAKVERDRAIDDLKARSGIDFGSGYPSDPKTREFVERHGRRFEEIIRWTWKTCEALAPRTIDPGDNVSGQEHDPSG